MSFVHDDFLLTTQAARRLYHEYAEDQPILDYHCHLSPKDIAEDRQFATCSRSGSKATTTSGAPCVRTALAKHTAPAMPTRSTSSWPGRARSRAPSATRSISGLTSS